MYVRQHYKLATTGRLGQRGGAKPGPKGGSDKSSMSRSTKSGSGYGSSGKKTPC
jgi:hypothetical protein